MILTTNTRYNSIYLEFVEDEPFDPGILEKIQDGFRELEPTIDVNVRTKGLVPIEALAYITEVANHCNLFLAIDGDIKGEEFIKDLKLTTGNPITLLDLPEYKDN